MTTFEEQKAAILKRQPPSKSVLDTMTRTAAVILDNLKVFNEVKFDTFDEAFMLVAQLVLETYGDKVDLVTDRAPSGKGILPLAEIKLGEGEVYLVSVIWARGVIRAYFNYTDPGMGNGIRTTADICA